MKIGQKVKPSKLCRPLTGDPSYMVITDIDTGMYLTNTYPKIWFGDHELIPYQQDTFTLKEVKKYAFWAVQHSVKLEKENPGKPIDKSQIDEYLDFEIG